MADAVGILYIYAFKFLFSFFTILNWRDKKWKTQRRNGHLVSMCAL